MARPISRGFPYFTVDSDIFYSDRNLRALMGKYGAHVITLYLYILCEVYRGEGYYCVYDDVFVGCAASQLNISCKDIEDMLDGLLERSLFDKGLFEGQSVLTSHGIQKRFQEMSRERGRKNEIMINSDLWLLNTKETEAYIIHNSGNNHSYSGNNPDYSGNNPTKEKESKENKSKENQSKENQSNLSAADSSKHPYGDMNNVLLTDEEYKKLKEKFPEDYLERIDRLSYGISSRGYDYKSHYATIVKWANDEKKAEEVKAFSNKRESVPKSRFRNFEEREYSSQEAEDIYFAELKERLREKGYDC